MKKTLILSIIIGIILFICACKAKDDSPRFLYRPSPANYVHLSINKDVFTKYMGLQSAGDNWGVGILLFNKMVISIPNGTKCSKVGSDTSGTQVRILEGEHKGLTGWVETSQVHKDNPMETLGKETKAKSITPKIAVDFDGTNIKITNADSYDWVNCGLALNDWQWFYASEAGLIFKTGQTVSVPAKLFKNTDGIRFNTKTTKPRNLNLSCVVDKNTFLEWRHTWNENVQYSNKYPTNIPPGLSRTILGKYRVIEYDEGKTHILSYDANKIEKKPDGGIKIFPPAYVQELYLGKWYEETYNEPFETIFSAERISVIENSVIPKTIHYPKERRVKK